MRRALTVLTVLMILTAWPAAGEMYKWQDADGTWHFTNQKPPDDVAAFDAEKEIRHIEPDDKPAALKPNHVENQDIETYGTPNKFLNPIAKIDRAIARDDLKKDLEEDYGDNYATIKMLLDTGMNDYDKLVKVPSNRVNDHILRRLIKDYYPSFSAILMLYEADIKAYKDLQD